MLGTGSVWPYAANKRVACARPHTADWPRLAYRDLQWDLGMACASANLFQETI